MTRIPRKIFPKLQNFIRLSSFFHDFSVIFDQRRRFLTPKCPLECFIWNDPEIWYVSRETFYTIENSMAHWLFSQKWQIAPPIDVSYETFDSFTKKWLKRRPFCSMFHMKHDFAKQRISKTLGNRRIVRVWKYIWNNTQCSRRRSSTKFSVILWIPYWKMRV